MRILYLTESLGWSGGAEQLLTMACALRRRGQEVVLACQPGSDVMERARSARLPVEAVRMRQDYDLPATLRVARILKRGRFDLLHAQHSTAHALGLVAAFLANVPAFAVTRRVGFPIRKNLFSRFKYRSRRVNGYVAVSESVKEELLRAGIPGPRVEVIPSVIHQPPASRWEGMELRRQLKLPEDQPVILTVANYSDFKGHEFLLKATGDVLGRFPGARFLLVGRNTEKLQPLVDRLGISQAVLLAGFRTDIPQALAAADIFVLPSLQEGASTALREAMDAGLPVIGTRVGGIPESIRHEETGLLAPPGDGAALAAAILRILERPEWARTLAEKGRAWVRERFSLEQAVEKMEAFYQRLLIPL